MCEGVEVASRIFNLNEIVSGNVHTLDYFTTGVFVCVCVCVCVHAHTFSHVGKGRAASIFLIEVR